VKGSKMKKLFGTDGIRSKYGEFPLTEDFVKKIGISIGQYLASNAKQGSVYIAKDTRFSGDDIESFLIEGLQSFPLKVKLLGVIPTAALSYITKKDKADLGIMISASHNLSHDNGIKLFANSGFKLDDKKEYEIESRALKLNENPESHPDEKNNTFSIENDDNNSLRAYIGFAKGIVAPNTLDNIKILIDCSHGATSNIAEMIFSELGANVRAINDEPDGHNINFECGSQHPQVAAEELKKFRADVGFSYDGDGDRVILIDNDGKILDGDYIMAMLARYLLKNGLLKQKTVVATVMSNMGLEEALSDYGIKVVRTEVGDKKVVECMLSHDYNFGGEQSGHIVYLDNNPTGDGILTSLMILKMLAESSQKLNKLSDLYHRYPQVLVNIRVKEKKDFSKIRGLNKKIEEFNTELGDEGRIFLRYSGTEPLARIMIEAKDKKIIEDMADQLARIIESDIGE
jgi:phosphoglucosamine mutase